VRNQPGIRQLARKPGRQNHDTSPTHKVSSPGLSWRPRVFKHKAEIIEVAGTSPATTRGDCLNLTGFCSRSMARYDFRTPRLFVAAPLGAGLTATLDAAQVHYLASVLRMMPGDPVLAFNGVDGEWRAALTSVAKRNAVLMVETQTRAQPEPVSLHYLFSPLKRARLDYMVQKAVEMGVSRLHPVIMRHTQAERVNLDRMRANAIEAAEQCGILAVPQIAAPHDFARAIAALDPACHLVFCDEDAPCGDPVAALRADLALVDAAHGTGAELAVLIGPEGGFAEEERAALLRRPRTSRIALGPRILRADTAAVAALAVVQTAAGDWR
jgi:16S rRNA (uracil1498-N3)-methyltransferase